jgi:hypothetical protein
MEDDLVLRFAQMTEDELLEQFASGELDESALALLTTELNRRGLLPRASRHVADMGNEGRLAPKGFRHLVRGLSPLHAHILLGRLREEGVDGHLAGANVTQIDPFWFQALGGVRLFVRTEHLAIAIDVINAVRDGEYDVQEPEEAALSGAGRLDRKREAGWRIVLSVAFVMGGITLVALWSSANGDGVNTEAVSPGLFIFAKFVVSAVLVAYAAVFLRVVEVAVRLQKQMAGFRE